MHRPEGQWQAACKGCWPLITHTSAIHEAEGWTCTITWCVTAKQACEKLKQLYLRTQHNQLRANNAWYDVKLRLFEAETM